MKSTITKLVALVMVLVLTFALASCGSNYTTYYYDSDTGEWSDKKPSSSTNNGGSNGGNNSSGNNYDDGTLKLEVSDIQQSIRYVDDDKMSIPVTNNTLDIDKDYTLELTFTVTPNNDSDGYSYFTTVLTFTDISILDGKIKEAETGKQIEQTVIDGATGTERKDISLSFKVPAEKDTEKEITILVGLQPVKVASNSQMLVDFSSEDAKITGSDGISRSFSINAAVLATPVVTFNDNNKTISWEHVKNADYYNFYIVGEDLDGTPVLTMPVPSGTSEGGMLQLSLWSNREFFGKEVYVKAGSYRDYFNTSEKSNSGIIWED